MKCPMCKKTVRAGERECPSCRTDLSLLNDYLDRLEDGLARAEALARAGELGDAVWAYLEVLEVDPDNVTARKQVGRVVAAVRHFDRAAPGRRWLKRLRLRARAPGWLTTGAAIFAANPWLVVGLGAILVGGTLAAGYLLGRWSAGTGEEKNSQPVDTAVVAATIPR